VAATQSPAPEQLRHELTPGKMAMVAVGGSIGTGLLLGSGAAIQVAGPGVILAFVIAGYFAFVITMALGEMACLHPGAGSFGIYADLYLNRWAGFVSRYGYWIAIVISISGELVASATYARFWFPRVPALAWIAIFSAFLLFINLREVGSFGGFQYWFAMIKVVVIFVFILLGAALLAGGRVAAHYTSEGGFLPHGLTGAWLAVAFALFSFLGTEMIAISSGEAQSVHSIAKATYVAFALLAFVYIGAISVLAGVLPWRQGGVGESPFVTVFQLAHVPAASNIMNFVVLTAALSGSNASLYATSRMIYSLALDGEAPQVLARLSSRGVPWVAILASAFGIVIALVVQFVAPQNAFLYIIGAALFGGMLAVGIALAAHIAMRSQLTPAQIAAAPLRAPGGRIASWIALIGITASVISTWWVPQISITAKSAIPFTLFLTIAYFVMKKSKSARLSS
jgi:L-asparagine transporter-like permease